MSRFQRIVAYLVWIVGVLAAFLICKAAVGQVQLMPQAEVSRLRASFPKLADQNWSRFTHDPTTLLYTHREMPVAYQFQGGFHDRNYNISGDSSENFKADGFGGNANVDLPWRVAGGLDEAAKRGITSGITMIWLPKARNGAMWPVVYWRSGDHWSWLFPRNAIVGEALYLNDSKGRSHYFEVRIRYRESDYWDVDVLRPFPHRDDLVAALRKAGMQMASKPVVSLEKLADRNHDRVGFSRLAYTEVLPKIPESTAMKLLDETTFRSAAGGYWYGDADKHVFAPTTNQRVSIVPYKYQGAFLGSDTRSCRACHSQTLVSADVFRRRGWYGRVRGSVDGIFSFHPVEPSAISGNGANVPVRFRKSLLQGGFIAPFDPEVHKADRYTRLANEEREF